jgi:hypothetical protein
VSTFEPDDFAAYGAVMDKFFADSDGQAVMSLLGSSRSPCLPIKARSGWTFRSERPA